MKRKVLGVLLTATMTAALLAGCGQTGTNPSAGDTGLEDGVVEDYIDDLKEMVRP